MLRTVYIQYWQTWGKWPKSDLLPSTTTILGSHFHTFIDLLTATTCQQRPHFCGPECGCCAQNLTVPWITTTWHKRLQIWGVQRFVFVFDIFFVFYHDFNFSWKFFILVFRKRRCTPLWHGPDDPHLEAEAGRVWSDGLSREDLKPEESDGRGVARLQTSVEIICKI